MHYLLEDRNGQMKMDTMEWRSYNKDKKSQKTDRQ